MLRGNIEYFRKVCYQLYSAKVNKLYDYKIRARKIHNRYLFYVFRSSTLLNDLQ